MTTRLIHVSDVHFGVEDRAALAAVARAVEQERPDALVCTGDLTQRATHAQYEQAREWFAQFDVPVWLDVGNHDLPYYNLWERFSDPYRRFRALQKAVAVAQFATDDVVLVPLKTTVRAQGRWPWSDGVVTPDALRATSAALAPLRDDPRTVIVTAHHPLHGPRPDEPSGTIGGYEALEELAELGANAVLSGHIHTPFNHDPYHPGGKIQAIGAGTLSTRLRFGAPPSYNVLHCERGKPIQVEARTLSDEANAL